MKNFLFAVASVTLFVGCTAKPPGLFDGGGGSGDGGVVMVGDGGTCSAATCPGCCKDGRCYGGDEDATCGTGGRQCDTCMAPTSCGTTGTCVTGCGPMSCQGCCRLVGGVMECNTGGETDATACGSGGVQCQNCGAGGSCAGGSCAGAACLASCTTGCCDANNTCHTTINNANCGAAGGACVACTSGTTCTNGACAVDPGSRWDVKLLSAVIPAMNGNGTGWDSGGDVLPEGYVIFKIAGGSSVESPDVNDTLTPAWSDELIADNVTAAQLKQGGNSIEMWDHDFPDPDDFIDRCTIAFQDFQFGTGLRTLTCGAMTMGENFPGVGFTVRVELVPHTP